jgi:beta-lactamase class A
LTCARWIAAAAALLLVATAAPAGDVPRAGPYPELRDRLDAGLQAGLEGVVRDLDLGAHVSDGRLSMAIADISDLHRPRLAALNGDRMMYASSVPKLAILLAAFTRAGREHIALDGPVREDVVSMIRYSNNAAATRVLDWAGREALLELLQAPHLRLYDPEHNGGLWVGKDYSRNPAFRPDPLHNVVHGATAIQAARYWYLLETGRLVSPGHQREMKEILGTPVFQIKLVRGLAGRPEARIFRKSGTWRIFHADSALVESGERRLILVVIAHDPRGAQWIVSLAEPLYDLLLGR